MSAPAFTPPPPPSTRRRRLATLAYLAVTVLVGMAIVHELHRAQLKKAAAIVPAWTAHIAPV